MGTSLTQLEFVILGFLYSNSDIKTHKTSYIRMTLNCMYEVEIPVSSYHSCLIRLSNKGFIDKTGDAVKPEGKKSVNWMFAINKAGISLMKNYVSFIELTCANFNVNINKE